jgi:hypothetical protein
LLAYVFWHRPRGGSDVGAYERAQLEFHRSLQRNPPVGLRASATYRLDDVPWLGGGVAPGYEDWYLLEGFATLGVLNEAAVGRGHRTSHDRAARMAAAGAGGLYLLIEGSAIPPARGVAVWVARPPGGARPELAELLADGAEPSGASLWRRQLVLGPAPEYCLLAPEPPAGTGPRRLPAGWEARTLVREPLHAGRVDA